LPCSPDPLGFLYDNASDLPDWLRALSYAQLLDIAKLMDAWRSACGGDRILPIEEVAQREIIRAVAFFGGDALQAAKALNISKTTIYRKLKRLGLPHKNRQLLHKAIICGRDDEFEIGLFESLIGDSKVERGLIAAYLLWGLKSKVKYAAARPSQATLGAPEANS